MIKFKTLKYKHQKRAAELSAQVEAGTASDDDVLGFVLGLVDSWDFADAETGEPLPVDTGIMGEISLPQYNELMAAFNAQMGIDSDVPKASA